ncbi:MAG: radical SAM protein [Bacteroidales bacterium]|nr:radical SAM protein [Bacteroidales bacterium]
MKIKYILKNGDKHIRGICPIPFTYVQTHDFGEGVKIFSCCPAAVKESYGVIDENHDFKSVWNSMIAKNFRSKLLKHDYSGCNLSNYCNIGAIIARLDYLNDKEIIYDKICDYPLMVEFSHDDECNVRCTMCRDFLVINSAERVKLLNERINKIFLPMLKKAKIVYLSGGGEVFFSKHYKVLIKMINDMYPDIKFIIHTNGMLLNESNCLSLGILDKIHAVIVSIHSTNKDTYEKIMRGAKWEILIENLNWIFSLKKNMKVKKIYFNYVIQTENYMEMPDMVNFARKYEATVRFLAYRQHGVKLAYNEAAIFDSKHPHFASYVRMLQNPVFKSENCYLDPWSEYLRNLHFIGLYLLIKKIIRIIKDAGIFVL